MTLPKVCRNKTTFDAVKGFPFIALSLVCFYPSLAWAQGEDICRYVTAYKQGSADYVPGVDVHGNPVVPADLNDAATLVTDIVQIPLTVELAEHFGLDVPDGVELEPVLQTITIGPHGRVMWDDQDLTAETIALCREKRLKTEGSPEKAEVEPPVLAPVESEPEEDDEELIWGESHLDY